MKGYQELSEKIVFSFEDVLMMFKHRPTAYAALRRMTQKGIIKKIRNNLYSCVNPITHTVFANPYQIGSSINEHCYISHQSAFAYYGYLNQVTNVIFVSSLKRFNPFEFEGISYQYVQSNSLDGVIEPPYSYKIKISDIEKTIIDSIDGIDSIVNLEELIQNLDLIPEINSEKLLHYLELYEIQALYQKTAFILSLFQDKLKNSEALDVNLRTHLKKGVTYLNEDAKYDGVFIKDYNLIVPKWITKGKQNHEI
jgi:predicted transcriptional regulator of viral defense system